MSVPNCLFDGDFNIDIKNKESIGWVMLDPNREYSVKILGKVQPGSGVRLYPLFVTFPKIGIYHASYSITSDDNIPKMGSFSIRVVAE